MQSKKSLQKSKLLKLSHCFGPHSHRTSTAPPGSSCSRLTRASAFRRSPLPSGGFHPKQGKDEKQSEGGDGEGWKEKDKGDAVTRASRGLCAQILKCDVGFDVPSLPNLYVIGWEEAIRTPAHTSPPPLVNHLNVGDDVIGVKGDLVITG